jgi:hypothetical protein
MLFPRIGGRSSQMVSIESHSMSIFGPPPDDPYIRAALVRALRDAPPFVPGPDPLIKPEDEREARELRETGRLN